MANFILNNKYTMPVKRVDSFNGRKSYVVEYEGEEYRIKKYDHQTDNKAELEVEYVGNNSYGKPQFQQNYTDVLYEIYEEDGTYPFKIVDECVDANTAAFYYSLVDKYGFKHRVYDQQSPIYKVGDEVECQVFAIENNHLDMDIVSKQTPKATYTLGDLVNLKKAKDSDVNIDFSALNPEADTTLRDYQIDNKRKIYKAWQNRRAVMLQMPTGTGKTRLFVSIARDLHNYGVERKRAIKILFLAHRKELIEQISEHVGAKYNLAHGLIVSQNMEQKHLPVQIGSVPTMTRRLDRWEDKDFDVIIIDEAHHVKAKSYKKIIDFYPKAKILGVTATPYRLNGAGFHPEFDELIISPSVAEFIKKGYLSEYVYYSIKPTSDLQKEIDRMKLDFQGDYLESEMMGVMDRDFIRARILSSYQRYAEGKKGIIYTISRAHNTHLAKVFNDAGIKSAAIDSETPMGERKELVNKFRKGDIQVLFNVNIFSEGFDCPDVEVIQLARPTKSLAMYLQQVGRGLRPCESKDNLIILDNVGLFNKFGFPSARRKWRYHFEGHEVDESPEAHRLEHDEEEREVRDILEGNEAVEELHDSRTEDVGQSALDNIEHDYEQSFIEYTAKLLNEHTAQSYARSLRPLLDSYIKDHIDSDFKSIFNIIDIQDLNSILAELRANSDFCQYNKDKHNVFTASLGRYISFAEWYTNNQNGEIPYTLFNAPSEETIAPEESVRTEHQDTDIQNEDIDIDAEIASMERVIAFHKKKHFPIPDELLAELDRLCKLKDERYKTMIIKEVEETIFEKFDLSNLESISYNATSDNWDVRADFDYQAELEDEDDMIELNRIMKKLNLELSYSIKDKQRKLDKAKRIQQIDESLYFTLNEYVESQKKKGVNIQSITYSQDKGITVDFTD